MFDVLCIHYIPLRCYKSQLHIHHTDFSTSIHRYSMPTTSLSSQLRSNASGFNNSSGLEPFSAAKYLFPSEEDREILKDEDRIPTPDIKSYLKLTEPDDKFPTLSRRNESGLVSAVLPLLCHTDWLFTNPRLSCPQTRTLWTWPTLAPPIQSRGTTVTVPLIRACLRTL